MEILALAAETYERRAKKLQVILTLDELKVTCHLDFSEKYSFWITSEDTEEILYEVEEDMDIRTPEEIAKAIIKMRDTLDELYYFKPLGKYILKDDKGEVLIFKVFKKFLQVDGCSICFEDTNVKTPCRHYCCHKCMEKIKICPICRSDLYE
jgi:hypothetical protein